MDKYENSIFKTGSFCGVINVNINLITCEDKNNIPLMLQTYALYWYHTYLFFPGMDEMELIIPHNLCWTGIRKAVQKEVNNCDTCQPTKWSNKNMANNQLRKLIEYHGKTLCRSNRYLFHTKKWKEIKFKY